MAKFGKWIGGGLGWAFAGPIGAIIGFALGAAVDNLKVEGDKRGFAPTTPGDFGFSSLVLSAAVMKADGKVMKSELNYVKDFLIRQFGEKEVVDKLQLLKQVIDQEFSTYDVCIQIKRHLEYQSRLQLLHFLFGIAQADGFVDKSEYQLIEEIGRNLGISVTDFESIKAMFYKDSESAYKILEITPEATISEIKSAYRKMAVKYHPDKLAHLGEEFQKAAKEKFQKVNEAYETLKKERGFN